MTNRARQSVDLRGRTAVVTGAASGFGRAIALAYLDAGARVALIDVSESRLEAVKHDAEPFGDRAVTVAVDLADLAAALAMLRTAEEQLGVIDILVNNAGIAPGIMRSDYVTNPVRFWEHDDNITRRFFNVNAITPYLLAKRLAPEMMVRQWGRIINVTTSLGSMMRAGMAGYAGSKAALEAHSAVMAGDLHRTGVTVNVLIPGGPANTAMVPVEAGFDRAALIQPQNMVPPALYLASNDAAHITGKRFVAALWDPREAPHIAAERAGAPAAWAGMGDQTIFPKRHIQAL